MIQWFAFRNKLLSKLLHFEVFGFEDLFSEKSLHTLLLLLLLLLLIITIKHIESRGIILSRHEGYHVGPIDTGMRQEFS